MPDKTAGQSIDILCIWRVLYNGSLTKSGSLEDVNAMQKYPDPTTLDEYIAKTKSESKPTSISDAHASLLISFLLVLLYLLLSRLASSQIDT